MMPLGYNGGPKSSNYLTFCRECRETELAANIPRGLGILPLAGAGFLEFFQIARETAAREG
jgi:hypothetical protein